MRRTVYSARNPIPNAQKFAKTLQERLNVQKQGGDELDDTKEQKNRRLVVDPVTKSNVVIQDIKGDFKNSVRKPKATVPIANVDPVEGEHLVPNEVLGADAPAVATGSGEEYRVVMDDLAPPEANPTIAKEVSQHSTKTKVLYHPGPVANLEAIHGKIESAITALTVSVVLGTVFLNWAFVGGKWKGFVASTFIGGVLSVALHLWLKRLQSDSIDRNWDSERLRAQAAVESLMPETTEWLNEIIGTVWNLINPEMFQPAADTLEDIMQASVPPSVIENVKVSGISQGSNPIRILSMRTLPDATSKKTNPLNAEQSEAETQRKRKEREQEDDPNSKYYNLEASFAYHALKATGVASKAQNIHLEIAFYLGVRGLFGVPLPIFAELSGIVGTVRLRFQMTPNPPFIKNLSMTFMGLPKISVSVVPMTQRGINVLNLPLISNFVNYAVGAALDEYVAPKSLSLDVGKMLEGASVQQETEAIGVIYIKIHDAVGIPAMDRGGGSDTYITLAFSEFGKPVYCTRVILKDRNPSWEEDTCILLHNQQIMAGEKLSVQLWDSDRIGKDDMVGRIEFDLHEIIENEGVMQTRSDTLIGEKDGKEVPGKLNWEVGFYKRTEFKKSMKTTGEDVRVPRELRHKQEFKEDIPIPLAEDDKLALNVPPDPNYPTGVVSITIHEIKHLEFERAKGTFGKIRPYSPAQVVGENKDEEGSHLPNAYCTVMVNDVLSFKTRTKVASSNPIFSAAVERYVRDWRNAVITVAARDSRHREHDPLLGVCSIKLSEALQTSSTVTRLYALDGGVGYGMVQLTILFRAVGLQLPRNLLGWDVGSIEIMEDEMSVTGSGAQELLNSRIVMTSDCDSKKIPRSLASTAGDASWNLNGLTVRLPVRQRYGSSLKIEFYSRMSRKPIAYCVYWLNNIIDNQTTRLSLPVWKVKDSNALTQNCMSQEDINARENIGAEQIATFNVVLRFKDGLDESHKVYMDSNDDRETFDAFEACLAEGSRRRIVKRETGATIKKLIATGATDQPHSDDETENITESTDKLALPRPKLRGHEPSQTERPTQENIIMNAEDLKAEVISVVDSQDEFSDDENIRRIAGDDPRDVDERHDLDSDDDSANKSEDEKNGDPDAKRARRERKAAERRQKFRKHRGIMQWKPARNMAFLKDELMVGAQKIKGKFGMKGRQPGLETELNQGM
ncbi:Tricalbin-1 [Drechslerella dactyloides]|uniref:Tricalbin-1 n=1 Tax=Drechslerella dactyloides TaxID=74499 RepID=A0AAD6J4B5_DREDA|nr:Tricalbin-1 [Drechslerella dactyloides]